MVDVAARDRYLTKSRVSYFTYLCFCLCFCLFGFSAAAEKASQSKISGSRAWEKAYLDGSRPALLKFIKNYPKHQKVKAAFLKIFSIYKSIGWDNEFLYRHMVFQEVEPSSDLAAADRLFWTWLHSVKPTETTYTSYTNFFPKGEYAKSAWKRRLEFVNKANKLKPKFVFPNYVIRSFQNKAFTNNLSLMNGKWLISSLHIEADKKHYLMAYRKGSIDPLKLVNKPNYVPQNYSTSVYSVYGNKKNYIVSVTLKPPQTAKKKKKTKKVKTLSKANVSAYFNYENKKNYVLLPISNTQQQRSIGLLLKGGDHSKAELKTISEYLVNVINLGNDKKDLSVKYVRYRRFYSSALPTDAASDILNMFDKHMVVFNEKPYKNIFWKIQDISEPKQYINGGGLPWMVRVATVRLKGVEVKGMITSLVIRDDGDVGELYKRVVGEEHPIIKAKISKGMKEFLQAR